MPRIVFRPGGQAADVPAGTTLFDAGSKVHAHIETACVGKGTCGLCRVRVLRGESLLSPYTEEEMRHIGNIYHLAKVRLACRTRTVNGSTSEAATGDDAIEVEVIARRRKGQNLVRK